MKSKLVVIGFLVVLSVFPVAGQVLKVCARELPPFVIHQTEPAGLELDLIKSFCEAEGYELEIIWPETFDRSFVFLSEGKCGVVASLVTHTPEREKTMDFSAGHFPVRAVLVSDKDAMIENVEALANKRVVTIRNTTYDMILGKFEKVSRLYVNTERDMFEAVAAGQADALVCDSALVLPYLDEFPDLRMSLAMSELQEIAFAFRKDSPLRPKLDQHLATLKQDGTYKKLLEKYFGEMAAYILEQE